MPYGFYLMPETTQILLPGLVTKAHSGFFTVHNVGEGEQRVYLCQAAGRLTRGKHTEDALAVGDRVMFEPLQTEGTVNGRIQKVLPRERMLARKDPIAGTNEREIKQVVVANLDLVVFVFACAQPEFKARMLDRYLVGAEAQKLPVLICASKVDLVGLPEARRTFADYERIGYRVVYTSAVGDLGIAEMRALLHGKLSVLTGKSGVGKSHLLNTLKPGLAQEVGKISELLKKGKHTTVVPELVALDDESWIADTPGLRSYAVWDVQAEELDGYYREIAPLVSRCVFSDCTHTHEPGCAVQAAVTQGKVSAARYDSYCRLREELEHDRKW
jgi:ribosome biogenesis GTPase / thiamine phosphate phosphatase